VAASDKGWNSISTATVKSGEMRKKMQGRVSISAVDSEMVSVGQSSVAVIAI
jgi:hypothetical protein